MDEPGWSEHAHDGDWIWREDRVREFLAGDEGGALFVGGCYALAEKKDTL